MCGKLFIDSKRRFWVGTRNGLLLFDRETKNFLPVLTVEGKPLEKHSIRAIVEGLNGELWIGTPRRIVQAGIECRRKSGNKKEIMNR